MNRTQHVATRTPDGAYESGDELNGVYLELDEQTLADMGYPETITVTVEPCTKTGVPKTGMPGKWGLISTDEP